MLSYCWGKGKETQKIVSRVRQGLTQRSVTCWMDIDGEHGATDIYGEYYPHPCILLAI
jgi:hypothetical protein